MTKLKPPAFLDKEAKGYWPDVIARLDQLGLLASVDPSSVVRLVQALSQYRKMTIKLNKEGQVKLEIHPHYEVEKVAPAFRVQESLVKQISSLLNEMGLLDAKAEASNAPEDRLAGWLDKALQGSDN